MYGVVMSNGVFMSNGADVYVYVDASSIGTPAIDDVGDVEGDVYGRLTVGSIPLFWHCCYCICCYC